MLLWPGNSDNGFGKLIADCVPGTAFRGLRFTDCVSRYSSRAKKGPQLIMEPALSEKHTERQFDWGPSSENSHDSIKEWGVYCSVAFLLAVCGWFLLDLEKAPHTGSSSIGPISETLTQPSNSPGSASSPAISQSDPHLANQTAAVSTEESGVTSAFFVQLGAFGDEDSAGLAMKRLSENGMVASLTAPNEQYEMYRILMGPFNMEAEAEKTARQLNELDFPCFVIESP